jgi:DNA-binding CsgD family transcriptional regulator
MRSGREIAFAPCAADSVTRDSVWPFAMPPAPRLSPPSGHLNASPDLADLACATHTVRTALEEMTVAAAAAVAGARAIVAVMDAAVAILDVAERAATVESRGHGAVRPGAVLSPRELEVLALVAEGHSNKAIAAALFVSPNTIKTHVASLMNKSQADSRAHLAAIAARHEVQFEAALGDRETLAS